MTLRAGKLPADVLAGLLARLPRHDPRVLVGPGVGRDAAVLDLGDRLLVAKSDPVTFATEDIGWYVVNVNANDVACMGARPSWFLATALLPAGAPDTLPGAIFDQLAAACEALGVELIGGHTEVTQVARPMVAGTMIGEASRDELIRGEHIEPGDRVLLTKGIAIEGTALLAREFAPLLGERGVPEAAIARAREMLFDPGISVVRDAQTIAAAARPRLLHDPTEGGVATALQEMAEAAGATLVVDPAAIPVLPETRAICEALGLDPLGLLASGALLAIVDGLDGDRIVRALANVTIACHAVGRVEAGPPRVILEGVEPATPLASFSRDEFARFYDTQ
ncbi:MAG: AIR synthase related protein [Dehalococcoidia bacterium]